MIKKIICITLFLIQGDIFPSVCLKQQTARFNLLMKKFYIARLKRYDLDMPLYDQYTCAFRGTREQYALLFDSSLLGSMIHLNDLCRRIDSRIDRCKSLKDEEILTRFLNCFENRVLQFEQDIAILEEKFSKFPVDPYF